MGQVVCEIDVSARVAQNPDGTYSGTVTFTMGEQSFTVRTPRLPTEQAIHEWIKKGMQFARAQMQKRYPDLKIENEVKGGTSF